jgi:hypothetical protein
MAVPGPFRQEKRPLPNCPDSSELPLFKVKAEKSKKPGNACIFISGLYNAS